MPLLPRVTSLLRNLFLRSQVDRDLDDEVSACVDLLADEKMRNGMDAEKARREARMELGGVEQLKLEVRGARAGAALENVGQDTLYAARMLRKRPAFTVIAVLTLAVGIGANTAIFSVVYSVLLRSMDYPSSERLAIVWTTWGNARRAPASGPELNYLHEHSRLFEDLGGIWVTTAALTGNDEPEQIRIGQVTFNFLSLLTAHPGLGRFFRPEEQSGGAPRVIALSNGLWRRRFGADPGILGRQVHLDGQIYTVVAVMPGDFRMVFPTDASVPPDVQAWVPFRFSLIQIPRDLGFIRIVGRLRPGVTIPRAQGEADGIASQLRNDFSEFKDQGLRLQVAEFHSDVVRIVRPALLILFGAVGLVLLLACTNVANLLLSRANERQREITLRAALGASQARIVRQLLTECIFLGCVGGVVALALGWGMLQALLALRPQEIARMGPIGFNLPILGFTCVISIGAGALSGLAPALRGSRVNLVEALKQGATSTSRGGQGLGLRRFLVVSEVALGFVLLAGAGLLARTFARLSQVDPGFDPRQVLTFQLSFAQARFPGKDSQSINNFLRNLQKNLGAQAGVRSVGAVSHIPFDHDVANWYSAYWSEGTARQEQNTILADHRAVLPGYFQSIGATLVMGRDFDESDDAAHPRVVIVDDALVQRTWPAANPLGKRLNVEAILPDGQFVRDWAVVVGVVKHIQYHSLSDRVREQAFFPYAQSPRAQMTFVLQTPEGPESLAEPIREEVAKLDKDLPVSNVLPLKDYVLKATSEARFTSMLIGALAAMALLLACIGIYGVTSCSVAQRTNEIGIRTALGAQQWSILRLVLGGSMLSILLGIAIGAVLFLASTPLLSGLLFGVRPLDPSTLTTVSLFLIVVAMLACLVPAYRASRVNPIIALRYD